MNERIKELLNRSGGEFYEGFLGSPNTIKFTEEELKTFAELIVQECKQAIKHEQDYLFDDGQYELSSHFSYLKERIDEHFGVEE
jgi:hypothetical protein